MNVLIINLCSKKESLHYNEFVLPIVDIIKKEENIKYEIIHFLDLNFKNITNFDKIIICGTSLIDFEYLENSEKFEVLYEFEGDILGICAGSQVVGLIFKSELKESSEIGLINIEIIKEDKLIENVNFSEIYSLHKKYVDLNIENKDFEIIAKNEVPQIFKLKDLNRNIYGVLFHPEVRNKNLIINFLRL